MTAANILVGLAPLLLLLGLLSLGRFPGERTIERLRALIVAIAARAIDSKVPALRPGRYRVTGGGRLIALSLAGRGPPWDWMFKT